MIHDKRIPQKLFVLCLLSILVISGLPAQQKSGSGGKADQPSGSPLKRLTIQFKNGTPGADGLGRITGVVFDYKQYKSSVESNKKSSLLQQLKDQGTGFRTTGKTAEITLEKPVPKPMVVVIYKDGIYQRRLGAGPAERSINMTVYEPTRNRDSVRLQRHHIPLQRRGNKLRVSEVMVFKNTGKKTYVGPEGFEKSIPITLPAEAHRVRIGGVERQPEAGDDPGVKRYWLSKTLSPDKPVSVRLSYHLPLEGKVTLKRRIDYLTSVFFFVAGKRGINVVDHSSGLSKRNRSAPSGKQDVVQLSANNLQPGRTVSVTIKPSGSAGANRKTSGKSSGAAGGGSARSSGSPESNSPAGGGDGNFSLIYLIVVGVVAGLALIASIAAIVLTYRAGGGGLRTAGAGEGKTRELLLEEIARLDQDLEDGKISEEYHEQRRERLKSRLMELERNQPGKAR